MLAVFFHKEIFEKSTKKENLMFNLSMVNGCIMFIGIFGTANYFARLANYFVMAQAITLPNMVNKLNARNRKFVKISMIIGYLLFFYYDCNIVYGEIQSAIRRLTVMEYLQQLF